MLILIGKVIVVGVTSLLFAHGAISFASFSTVSIPQMFGLFLSPLSIVLLIPKAHWARSFAGLSALTSILVSDHCSIDFSPVFQPRLASLSQTRSTRKYRST